MKNIMLYETFTGSQITEGLFKKKKPGEENKPEEVPVPEELKVNPPNEKLFVGTSPNRELAKKKAADQAMKEGYPFVTNRAQLSGTQDEEGKITAYTYKIVMSKAAMELKK